MLPKSGFSPKNPSSKKAPATTSLYCPYCTWVSRSPVALSYHINVYHEAVVAAEGERARERGEKLNRFGTRDYGLPMWECQKCHSRIGPALIPYFRRKHNRWGVQCDGELIQV